MNLNEGHIKVPREWIKKVLQVFEKPLTNLFALDCLKTLSVGKYCTKDNIAGIMDFWKSHLDENEYRQRSTKVYNEVLGFIQRFLEDHPDTKPSVGMNLIANKFWEEEVSYLKKRPKQEFSDCKVLGRVSTYKDEINPNYHVGGIFGTIDVGFDFKVNSAQAYFSFLPDSPKTVIAYSWGHAEKVIGNYSNYTNHLPKINKGALDSLFEHTLAHIAPNIEHELVHFIQFMVLNSKKSYNSKHSYNIDKAIKTGKPLPAGDYYNQESEKEAHIINTADDVVKLWKTKKFDNGGVLTPEMKIWAINFIAERQSPFLQALKARSPKAFRKAIKYIWNYANQLWQEKHPVKP